jgi:hypothetical protein
MDPVTLALTRPVAWTSLIHSGGIPPTFGQKYPSGESDKNLGIDFDSGSQWFGKRWPHSG